MGRKSKESSAMNPDLLSQSELEIFGISLQLLFQCLFVSRFRCALDLTCNLSDYPAEFTHALREMRQSCFHRFSGVGKIVWLCGSEDHIPKNSSGKVRNAACSLSHT